jgi:hypothetical protein
MRLIGIWLDLHEMTAEDAADYKAQGYTLDNPPSFGRRAAIEATRKNQRDRKLSGE